MNPIPLSERGQFRYADFVEYIPEFLWDEPDVVELLQVMSDYINDAYRNIEDVEEFEFKLCVAESKLGKGRRQLERLRSMFTLASGRGDRVYYLSVPRANVKSNAVFGKGTGYTPYHIDTGLSEVADEIPNINSVDRKVGELADGDVVFVRYTALDPVVTKAYYYSRETQSLVIDPEGTTQDPFTDTDNAESRMISFLVSDISSINRRFGGISGGNSYYEIFFNARISDVKSEPAVETVELDADQVNDVKDTLVIDYYGMTSVPNNKFYATMSFYGEKGWAWKSGYPTGMFYLKDTSGSRLDAVGDALGENRELAADPSVLTTSAKYALSGDARLDPVTGTWTFVTSSPLPQMPGSKFYVVDAGVGEVHGEFALVQDSKIDDRYSSRMTETWCDESYEESGIIPMDSMFLMTFPLYYGKGVPAYASATPLLTWKHVSGSTDIDWKSARMSRFRLTNEVRKLGEPFIPDSMHAYSFIAPSDVYAALVRHDPNNPPIYSGDTMWEGLVKPVSVTQELDGRGLFRMQAQLSAASNPVQLYAGMIGMLNVTGEGEGYWSDKYTVAEIRKHLFSPDSPESLTGFLACYAPDGSMIPLRVESIDPDTLKVTFSDTIAVGHYACSLVDNTGAAGNLAERITEVSRYKMDYWRGVPKKSTGDIYTDGIFYVTDSLGNSAFVEVGDPDSPIRKLEPNASYLKGDVVYAPGAGLYECISNYTTGDDKLDIAAMPEFRVEQTRAHRIGYTEVYNAYMPYYGQVKALDFGGKVEYTGDMGVATVPLYITKVVENRLKYGWEHREFLNYGTLMNMSGRDRNGSVDVFSSARTDDASAFETSMDVVTSTLDQKARWVIDYPVIMRGADSAISVDIDNPATVPAEGKGDHWTVTLQSAGHGMPEGASVMVTGFPKIQDSDVNGIYRLHVIDGDTVSFDVPSIGGAAAGMTYISVVAAMSVVYVGDYWLDVADVTNTGGNAYTVSVEGKLPPMRSGDTVTLYDVDAGCGKVSAKVSYDLTVSDVLNNEEGGSSVLTATCPDAQLSKRMDDRFQLRRTIEEGDYVLVGDGIYRVSAGSWEEKERNDISTPSVLVSKENLMDITGTNPEFALGEDIRVDTIIPEGPDVAVVRLKDMLPHFTVDNAAIINDRTMVCLRNVTPSQYNGWHTVTEVIGPKEFRMTVRLPETAVVAGTGVNGGEMYLNEGRWYAFTIKGMDWDKVSNRVTYSLNNTIEAGQTGDTLVTKLEHRLEKGDYVIVGEMDTIISADEDNKAEAASSIRTCVVSNVIGKTGLQLVDLSGNPVTGFDREVCIARGVVLTDRTDDLGSLRNEYGRRLASLGGERFRFRAGDIVVALAQQNPCEVKAWKVVAGDDWQPVRAKRSMKINSLGVYSYGNGVYNGLDVEADQDTEKYDTFSDVDVAGFDADVYVAGYRCVEKQNFSRPYLDDLDTTRAANAEYSSGEDFSTVSPRHNMKASFKGVPSMKYPLVEKIERLCYLRDAHVIDYEMIEYLARFLGYDITALGDDVAESNLYTTRRDRELAVRETVANLPQYYALGGTKAGLHMLLCAFGVIADVLTLWTDANSPYSELITRDEVVTRMEDGDGGKWVPSPYIDIEVTNDAALPQFSATQSDIERLREQIRVCKPINVVFRDFLYKIVDTARVVPTVAIGEISGSADCGAVTSSGGQLDIRYSEDELNTCSF